MRIHADCNPEAPARPPHPHITADSQEQYKSAVDGRSGLPAAGTRVNQEGAAFNSAKDTLGYHFEAGRLKYDSIRTGASALVGRARKVAERAARMGSTLAARGRRFTYRFQQTCRRKCLSSQGLCLLGSAESLGTGPYAWKTERELATLRRFGT